MIHRYAAWFCQGGSGEDFPTRPLIGWPLGDPELLGVLRCQTWFWGYTCSAMMLWGYRDVWIGGWWRDFCTYMGQVLGCHGQGKCVAVIVANMHVQHFSHVSASRRISADLYTSYSSSLCPPNQLEDLLSAVWCHPLLTDGNTAFIGHLQQNKELHFVVKPVHEK